MGTTSTGSLEAFVNQNKLGTVSVAQLEITSIDQVVTHRLSGPCLVSLASACCDNSYPLDR